MKTNGHRSLEQIITERRDSSLIKTTLEGDEKSFARLISFYKKRITALGMSFFKNAEDTEDFIQEVFIKVYTNLKNFRGESSFSTWITTIAYHTAINSQKRKQEYLPLIDQESITDKDYSPEKKEIRKITEEAIREAVKELPEQYAMCIELYFFYDNSHAEISKITGLPVNTIKSHIFRAKKILKEKLRGFYEN
ncbi:MAG: sigma-70 family RNA polymerase sigma factor [Treponema sp.]|nr:sigma-70 family RNA polymerase sigma factor [Candidatus Treponema equifaecale]